MKGCRLAFWTFQPRPHQSVEAQEVRRSILSSFRHIRSFSMRRPSAAVIGGDFNGTIKGEKKFQMRAKSSKTLAHRQWFRFAGRTT